MKKWYSDNTDSEKSYAYQHYLQFKSDIMQNKLENRKQDRAERRQHYDVVKRKITTDSNYKDLSRKKLSETTGRLEQNSRCRHKIRHTALIYTHRRLKNHEQREKHKQKCLINTKR